MSSLVITTSIFNTDGNYLEAINGKVNGEDFSFSADLSNIVVTLAGVEEPKPFTFQLSKEAATDLLEQGTWQEILFSAITTRTYFP